MADPISGIDADAAEGGADLQEMLALNQQQHEEEFKRLEFQEVAESAISTAIDRPGGASEVSNHREELLGGLSGEIGEAKSELVSDVARAGTEQMFETSEDAEAALEDRMMSLYFDLTEYQVAWRIAQKIPQDLSQILKGS